MSAADALIRCEGCGRTSPWKPQYAGRKLRCKCGHVIEVRAAPAEDDPFQIVDEPKTPLLGKPIVVVPGAAAGAWKSAVDSAGSAGASPQPETSTVAAPANPFDDPDTLQLAGAADVPADPPPQEQVSDPDDYGSYGLAPMAAIPLTSRSDPIAAFRATRESDNVDDDDDDDDLLPAQPARGGAVAAMPGTQVLGYNSARRRKTDNEEQAQVASYQRKEMVIPAILIAVGLLVTFVQARVALGEFNILMMTVYVAVATVINLVLISTALLVAARLLDLGLGEIGPALLKIAAVAILPSAIGGIIQESIGFVGGMLSWVITMGCYFVLLMWLFEMDTQEMMIATVLIWFMRQWVAYFIIMAIFSGYGDDDASPTNAGGGGNGGWVAPGGSGGGGGDGGDPGDPDTGSDPATQPATPVECALVAASADCLSADCLCGPATAPTTAPSTKPAPSTGDSAIDFLLESASEAPGPSTAPTSRPANPFADRQSDINIRPGVLHLSNGEKIRGQLATTDRSPIRVWVEKEKAYRDIPFAMIASVDAKLLWERDEKEWRFKESGSDIKEYSGKTYPVRELEYTVTLADGKSVHGGVVAPIYLQTKEGHVTFVLHKRQKGEVGQTLKDLVYLSRVLFE